MKMYKCQLLLEQLFHNHFLHYVLISKARTRNKQVEFDVKSSNSNEAGSNYTIISPIFLLYKNKNFFG